jgi:DNA-directed RNA polymerase specialized sigma24 family protein
MAEETGPGDPATLPAFREWFDRVCATADAVSYTCRVRLGDAAVAEAIAVRVAAGLCARPAVFRHWGLPYSGRIAKLAEGAIEDALAGRLGPTPSWASFRADLGRIPAEHQQVLVLTCVEGWTDERVAAELGCDAVAAGARRAAVLEHLQGLAAAVVAPVRPTPTG